MTLNAKFTCFGPEGLNKNAPVAPANGSTTRSINCVRQVSTTASKQFTSHRTVFGVLKRPHETSDRNLHFGSVNLTNGVLSKTQFSNVMAVTSHGPGSVVRGPKSKVEFEFECGMFDSTRGHRPSDGAAAGGASRHQGCLCRPDHYRRQRR